MMFLLVCNGYMFSTRLVTSHISATFGFEFYFNKEPLKVHGLIVFLGPLIFSITGVADE